MRNIEARSAKLEEQSVAVEQRIHVVFDPDCRIADEVPNEAQRKKALEANPPPEGARVIFVVGVRPKESAPEKIPPETERPLAPAHVLPATPVVHEPPRDPPPPAGTEWRPSPPTIRVWP